jgi:poly(hydroxyalkanoate) depolymerase family esterase
VSRWAAAGLIIAGVVAASSSSTAWVSAGAPANGCAQVLKAPPNWPAGEPGTIFQCSYSQGGLSRTSFVYQPTSYRPPKPPPAPPHPPVPVVVVLHGCTEQGPDIAYLSRFDLEAEKHGFLVVYPNQADYTQISPTAFDGNGSHCWNWFLPQGQQRGSGEPALIAGLTREAVTQWQGDPARTFVIGISAGGAMSDIMAATYPDMYAATAILAGCEYRGLPCLGSASAVPPQQSSQWAYQASGGKARVVPFLVENGDVDPAVPLANAFEIVQQWQFSADYAVHHGTLSNPVASGPCAQQQVVPQSPIDTGQSPPVVRNPYDVLFYSASGAPCPDAPSIPAAVLGELWIVHGEFHAYPGGPPPTPSEIYSNPGGPDITHAAYEFFMAHPCPITAGACAAS